MSMIPELDHLKISLDDIKLATNSFADHNFIGKGGFGPVYKGQLPAGTVVAVKRLDVKHGQGEHQFLMEIVMLASYKHDNLATLIGFCDEGDEKIIVYKHEARGSLDKHLANTDLTWSQRLQICLGAARGEPWSIRFESHQKLRKIFIDHQSFIYSIAFATEDINNDSVHYFQQHGGAIGPSGYTISQINFDKDEEIIGIQGTFGVVQTVPFGNIILITSLCLLTNKKTHGPFGKEEGTHFSESWNVGSLKGFYGRAGSYLDSFGCLLKAIP